ncbi:MAG: YfhO family protein [Roseiflexaceae bacterium]
MHNDLTPSRSPLLAPTAYTRTLIWRLRATLVVAALLLLPLIVFLRLALLRDVFYFHDVQYYFYPYHALAATLVGNGELPLWNPYAFSGLPLIGDGQTAMFYPPNWLFFLLPGSAAMNYDVLLQFSIAGIGLFLFVRSVGLWRLPAFLGAVAYMFCGFLTARVVHLSILSGAALLPLLFLCVERALHTRTRRWFAAAAGAVALQALAGHPQVPVYSALAIAIYTLVCAGERWWSTHDRRWLYAMPLRLAGIYLLGYGLAAIQLAPWVELGSFSPRAAGASFDFVFGGSMAGSNWLLFLFPYLYGSIAPGIYGAQPLGIATAVKLWEHSAYVGILPLALAGYALLGLGRLPGRTKDEGQRTKDDGQSSVVGDSSPWFSLCAFALILVVGLVVAAGKYTPFANLIYLTPVIGKLRDVERALALVAFALAVLAAFGMQRLITLEPRRDRIARPSLLLLAIAIVLLPVCVLWLAQKQSFQHAMNLLPQEIANLHLQQPNAGVPLSLALLSAALLLWWSRRRAGAVSQALAVSLVLLDLGSYAVAFNPTTDPQLYRRQPDVLTAFSAETLPFRKATLLPSNDLDNRTAQETLAVSWSMVYGVEDINGFNSLQPRRYTDYLFGPQVGDVSYGLLNNQRLLRPQSPILNALNVKYVLVPSNVALPFGSSFRQVYANAQVRVYENPQAYPRAYFADMLRGETDPQALLRTVTADGFDGRRLALVESDQPPALQPSGSAANTDKVTITQSSANQIVLATQVAQPRFLVLSEMYFPGWRATIDGAETPIYRTNYLFRGITVPAGQHTVMFVYRPVSALIGAAISLVALAMIGFLLRRPKSSTRPS